MLKWLKPMAIAFVIAVGAVAVTTIGAFIGTLLLILGAVAGVAFIMWGLWMALKHG